MNIFMNRVRILFFVGHLRTGGLERQLLHLASGLNRQRFDVMVWTTGAAGLVTEAMRERGVRVFDRPFDLSTSQAVDDVIQWLRELQVTLFFSFASFLWPDTVVAKTAGIPLCFTRRSNMRQARTNDDSLSLEERVRNADADMTVVLCRAMETECLETEAISRERLAIVYNGVPFPREIPPRRAGMTVGNVANYRPQKGQAELVRALAEVRKRAPADLLIVGRSGGELDPLIAEMELQESVRFVGEVAEPAAQYEEMNVYGHPSWVEGLPGAVLEAMAHGLAVVATPVGGVGEIVEDGVSGYLVPVGDIAALGEALTELLEDPAKSERMGLAGRERVRAMYTVERMVADYEALFESALARVAPRAPGVADGELEFGGDRRDITQGGS